MQGKPPPAPIITLPAPPPRPPREGDLCPHCGTGRLEYDGLLNLSCPVCGKGTGGCFT